MTIQNKIYSLLSLVTLLCISSCEWDTRLHLVNETNDTICYHDEKKSKIDSIPNLTRCETDRPYWVNPHDDRIVRSTDLWDVYFKNHPDNVLRIFVMSQDTLRKYGTCKVFRDQMFLKRIDLTYDSMVALNWKVVFDGKR
jgi:hypothetical protein